MLAVIVPAKNEEARLPSCLESLFCAALDPALLGETVEVVVVLDGCTDGSARVVASTRATALQGSGSNVGAARALGAQHALNAGARWLAFTDADTRVSPNWLSAQLALRAQVVCGTIEVTDWSRHPLEVGARFRAEYCDRDGHRHIHGANLGVCSRAYQSVGGFQPLRSSEDVALVRALELAGAGIAWSAAPRVVTSCRLDGRAPQGFAAEIRNHCLALTAVSTSTGER